MTSTPADVVKTRLMNDAGGQQRYTGMLHVGRCILREEGVGALYSGFAASVVRRIYGRTIFFVTFGQIKAQVDGLWGLLVLGPGCAIRGTGGTYPHA